MNLGLIRAARLVAESFEELDRGTAQIATPLLKQLVEAAEERNEAVELLRNTPALYGDNEAAWNWSDRRDDFLDRIDKEES